MDIGLNLVKYIFIGARHRKERLYHIDDTPSGVAEVIQDLDRTFQVSFLISSYLFIEYLFVKQCINF